MENKTTKTFTEKFLGLPLTGIALLSVAATSTGLLVIDKLIPMMNGTLMAELFPGAEGGIVAGVTALFGVTLAVSLISYLLMALLGVNALRYSKNPDGVKAATGLAKFLIFTGVVSLITSVVACGDVAGFSEKLFILAPSLSQLVFVSSFLVEAKKIRTAAV